MLSCLVNVGEPTLKMMIFTEGEKAVSNNIKPCIEKETFTFKRNDYIVTQTITLSRLEPKDENTRSLKIYYVWIHCTRLFYMEIPDNYMNY